MATILIKKKLKNFEKTLDTPITIWYNRGVKKRKVGKQNEILDKRKKVYI